MCYKNSAKTGARLLLLLGAYFILTFNGFSAPLDSVGIEKLGNKTFVLHKVDPKETLFSLAKRYNVKVSQIEIENPEVKEGVKVGQILRILYVQKIPANAAVSSNNSSSDRKLNKTHVVEPGQTLYSISRIYKVPVEDIKKWNGLTSNELNVGQEIVLSASAETIKPTQPAIQKPDSNKSIAVEAPKNLPNFKYDGKGNKVHVTEHGQTLFSLSQIYDISVDDIKKWNNLSNNEISEGQEIIVDMPREKEATISKNDPPKDTQLESSKSVSNSQPQITSTNNQPTNSSPPKRFEVPKSVEPVSEVPKSSNNSSGFNKIIERGLAESIDEPGETPKFLALHKTASVGTIIQVKNELNNLYIFARVIGKLPETGSNDKLVVKLSKKAYDKLGAVDKRFPVEVSYVPNN